MDADDSAEDCPEGQMLFRPTLDRANSPLLLRTSPLA